MCPVDGRELTITGMLDLIICVVLGLGLYAGYRKGAVGQIVSFAAIIVAIIASRLLGPACAHLLTSIMGGDSASVEKTLLATVGGHIIVFLLAYWATGLLSDTLRKLVETLHLGIIDSIAGSLFMGLKVILAASLLINLWMLSDDFMSDDSHRPAPGGVIAQSTAKVAPALLGYIENNTNL